jgi:hypothetical protein
LPFFSSLPSARSSHSVEMCWCVHTFSYTCTLVGHHHTNG